MKRPSGSSARGTRAGRNGHATRRIDFSDVPELSDRQLKTMRRVGRPPLGTRPRKLITIRLDQQVLAWIKAAATKRGLPYQSLINNILAREMRRVA